MITKNEEKSLAGCLDSVKDIVSEIIIVDTGSTDKTVEVAKRYTEKVFSFKWVDDFSKARNAGLKHATQEWILVLDADELLDSNGKKKILKLIERNTKADGFLFEHRSYVDTSVPGCKRNSSSFEQAKEYGFMMVRQRVRLFRNKKNIVFKHRVHELVEDSMRDNKLIFEKSDVTLHHLGSVKGDDILNEKKGFYSNLLLKQLEDDPNSARYNYHVARYYMGIGDLDKALRHFQKTARIDESYKLVYSDIAKVYLQWQDMDSAIEHFRKSWKLNKDNPSPANNLAVLLMHKKHFSDAKDILEKQMKRNPNNKSLQMNYQQLLKEIRGNSNFIAS